MRASGEAAGLEGFIGRRIAGVYKGEGVILLRFTDGSQLAVLAESDRITFRWFASFNMDFIKFLQMNVGFEKFFNEHSDEWCAIPRDAEVFKFNDEMRHQFIHLWSAAVPGQAYVKAEWGRFGEMLDALGVYPESNIWSRPDK